MFHCHNLQHEDNGMMGAFNATAVNLTAFGYPDNATFTDPMAAIWRSRPIVANTSAQEMHDSILPMFLSLGAYVFYPVSNGAIITETSRQGPYANCFHTRYPDEDAVEQALAQYYSQNNITAVDGIPPNV